LQNKGKVIVFSAPSGGGKSTIIESLRNLIKLDFSISATTRLPRGTEQNGVEYFFLSHAEFEEKIRNEEFVEYKNVYGNYYGTLKQFIRDGIEKGHNTIFDVDVQGALAIKEQFPEAILIFIYPPDLEELKARLVKRGTDSLEAIEKRLSCARQEMSMMNHYDYQVKNEVVEDAVNEIRTIFLKHNIN